MLNTRYSQLVLIIIILLESASSYYQTIEFESTDKKETQMILEVHADRIATIIDGTIKVTEILEELIILHNGDAPLEEVVRLSSVLFDENIHISLSYAPNGVIEYSYPVVGNEKTIGHRLLEDPITKRDAQLAVNTKKPTLSKPYILRQGSLAAVVRDPVFIKKDGEDIFWGFIAIAMRSSEGLRIHSDITSIEKFGYDYSLSYYYYDEKVNILQSSNYNGNISSQTKKFETKYGMWELSMYRNKPVSEIIKRIASLVLFILALGLSMFYFARYLQKRRFMEN